MLRALTLTPIRKQAVSSQSQELEALEARLRETEERLKQKQTKISSYPDVGGRQSSPHRRQPVGTAFGTHEDDMPQVAFPSPRGTQSSLSQAEQPPIQGLSARSQSRQYKVEDQTQGAWDGRYTHGAAHETASRSVQWPPPGTRYE